MNSFDYQYGSGAIVYDDDYGEDGYACSSTSSLSIVRPKEEWGGISVARCHDPNTPWVYRCQGQMILNAIIRVGQNAIRRLRGDEGQQDRPFAVKPQLSALYTSYPNPALVAAGHTFALELKASSSGFAELLDATLGEEIVDLYSENDPAAIRTVLGYIISALGNRAVVEEAARHSELRPVEHYRLFQASQSSLLRPRLSDVIDMVVLFGDVLPPIDAMPVHPMTSHILTGLAKCSRPYFDVLAATPPDEFTDLFSNWALDLLDTLAPTLPARVREGDAPKGGYPNEPQSPPPGTPGDFKYGNDGPAPDSGREEFIPPLNTPQPPTLSVQNGRDKTPEETIEDMIGPDRGQDGGGDKTGPQDKQPWSKEINDATLELYKEAEKASGQTGDWADIREDIAEQILKGKGFMTGPIEGLPTEGHLVDFSFDGIKVGGQLKDRPMELCEDSEKVDSLRMEAAPIAAALRKNLYPSDEEQSQIEKLRTSGQLDAKRLAVAHVCQAAFRRYRVSKEPSPKGRAVLLVAADGSGSLSRLQMKMCKLLTAGWLDSAQRANVLVLAALYHSEDFCNTPLVQWVYHLRKTPVMNPSQGVRAVASLPDRGTGAQSDAISLKYMLDEAVALARGSQIYLTLISDCSWNKCLHESPKSAEEEVAGVLKMFRQELGERLHVTLVALGGESREHVEGVVDKMVVLGPEALCHPAQAAESVAAYVAACIRERRRSAKQRH